MSIAVLYMMLLLAIATIGTVTGWLAVVQIRKSRGAIRGMRLALFAGLTFPLLVLDAVLHAAAKAFFHPWMTAGSTQSVILSRLIILLLIILDIVIIRGIWRTINPSPLASSDQAAPPTRPASAPPSRKSWGWFTTILVLHTIAWVAATVFLVKIVPHFMQIFDEVACNLPEATTHTIDISQFVLHGGFLLIPVLLAADFGICWLLQARASRKLLIAWGMTSLLALIGVLALGIFVIVFPYQAIVKEMSHGTSPSLKENSQTSSKNQQTSGEPTVSFDPAAGLRLIQEAPFTAKLPVGRVELVALARTPKSPVNPETWWRPNGMTWNGTFQGLSNWSFEKSGRENKDIFDLAFTVHDNPNQPSKLIIKFPPNSGVLNGRTSAEWLNDQRFPFLFRQRLACDPGTKTVDMLVGVADGPWETDSVGRFESGTGLTDDNKIVIKVIKENQNSTFVYRYMEKDGWARRMIVLGKDGEVCIGNDASQTGGGNDGIADGSITFNAETVAKIDGWKFQQRPLHWVEFRNVSLEPGKLTTVEVKDAVDENKPATVTNPNDTVAWPKGVDIKLLAVNDHPSRPGWWQADGTPAGEMKPFTNTRSTNLKPDEKFMARYFALDLTGIPATTGGLKLEGDSDAGPLEDLYDLDSGMHKPAKDWEYMSINPHRCEARVPRQAKTVTLRVGVPFGSWATSTPIPPASLQAEQKADGTLAVTTGYSDEEGKPRLVAITTDGRTIISSLRLVSRNGKELAKASGLWEFSNLPLAQVKEFRFQVRPYHWTVFRNVAVQPAAQAKNPPANLDLSLAPNWKAATPGQPSATATPTFEALTAEATMIIRKYFRDAQISFKDDEFVAKYSTQEFQVHTRFMTGKVSTDTHKEVGPAANGFILTINRQGKQQPEQAFMPHTAQYEYWQSYVSHAFPVRLMFDFGPQLEPAFKKEMFELLKRGQPETGYSEPTEP